MTNNEILDYYNNVPNVYIFNGTLEELNDLQNLTSNSYNYIKVQDRIYFAAQNAVSDSRAVLITKE